MMTKEADRVVTALCKALDENSGLCVGEILQQAIAYRYPAVDSNLSDRQLAKSLEEWISDMRNIREIHERIK